MGAETFENTDRLKHVSSDPSACPFCGQAFVDQQAVEHLAHQQAAYELELRRNVEVVVQAGADARIRDLKESLAAETTTPTPVAAGTLRGGVWVSAKIWSYEAVWLVAGRGIAASMARMAAVAAAVLTLSSLTGCVTNQIGSARNGGIYASKAARSANSALSAVETVRLVAGAASDGNVFGSYASVAIDQQEDALTEITALFRSIQPPDAESRQLRDELGRLLDAARTHLAAVRIEIRRGRLAGAATVAAPLEQDAAVLEAFAGAHE